MLSPKRTRKLIENVVGEVLGMETMGKEKVLQGMCQAPARINRRCALKSMAKGGWKNAAGDVPDNILKGSGESFVVTSESQAPHAAESCRASRTKCERM